MKQQQEEGSLLVCELELRDTLHCSGDQRWQRVYISMAYSKSASIDMLTVNRYMQFYDHTLYVNAMFQLGYLPVMPNPVLLCACFCGTLPCLLIQIHARRGASPSPSPPHFEPRLPPHCLPKGVVAMWRSSGLALGSHCCCHHHHHHRQRRCCPLPAVPRCPLSMSIVRCA